MRTSPSEHRIWEQAEYQWTNGCFFSALVLLIIQTNQYGCIFLPQHLFSHPKRCMHTALVDFHVPPDFALVCGTQTTSINKRLCCPIANAGSFFLQAEGSNQWHLPIRQQKNLLSACTARISSSYHDPSSFTQCCLCRPSA